MIKSIRSVLYSLLCASVVLTNSACGTAAPDDTSKSTSAPTPETAPPETEADTYPSDSTAAETQPEDTTDKSSDTSPPPVSESEPPPSGDIAKRLDSLPDRDLGASSVIIATSDANTVCPEDSDAPVISARVDARRAVEEKFGIRILTHAVDEETLFNEARTAYNSDMYYADLLAIPQNSLGSYVSEGMLANLRSMPFINLEADYFNSRITAASTAGDAIYAVGGSACLNPDYLSCVYFNRDLAEECGLGDIYSLVKSGEWTWDKLMEFSETAAAHSDETVGHATSLSDRDFTDLASHSMGIQFVSNELHTVPNVNYMNTDLADRWTSITDKLYTHMYGKRTFTNKNANDAIAKFASGNALFYTDRLYFMSWIFDTPMEWGILPLPKYDAESETYLTLAAPEAPIFCALANTPSYETSGIILEALNLAAYGYTADAYIEKCIDNYIRDNGSIGMLEIICQSQSTDFAHLYQDSFRYMKESTFGAVFKTVTTRTTLYNQYRNYRNTTNYWLNLKFKVYQN